MRVHVCHRSEYHYDTPASLGPHVIRLRPSAHTRARVQSYNFNVDQDCEVRWQNDPWGNRVARLTFPDNLSIRSLSFDVELSLDIQPINPFDFFVDDRCKLLPFQYPDGLGDELAPFLRAKSATPLLTSFVESIPAVGNTVDYLVALNEAVARRTKYILREEAGIQTSEETLRLGRGSCRDSAVLLVDVLRSRGLAARFVSGYLVQLADEGTMPNVPKGVLTDVVDLHAWAEAYVPGAGWIGLDGTSGLLTGEGHIPLAATVTAALAAPISGTASVPASDVRFTMTVSKVGHEPRPRKPYTDAQWHALQRAGATVDAILEAHDVALTCGGEPTFTCREHLENPEWRTEAVGPTKWRYGLRFARELGKRFGAGVLAMHEMGKLYPGESLPRWNLRLYWRKDGVPIWRNGSYLAIDPEGAGRTDPSLRDHFARMLSSRLGVPDLWMQAFEDPWVSLCDEANLPVDVDPLEATLSDSEARRRLCRLLGRGLGESVGLALPLRRSGIGWAAARWVFRREHLFLIPGDSPMGLRLPLDRIQGVQPQTFVADTTAKEEPLEFHPDGARELAMVPAEDSGTITRTTLCLEEREGTLHAFLPPTDTVEEFFALVAAIEDTAAELDVEVLVEGYGPPSDPRINACVVAPDPGVIEVNLPVCESLAQYTAVIELIHDAANEVGLCVEKYQLDGREVGSGGGNHLTLGGATPAASPFLVRPQLLSSLLRYLQNHPSLSYLFTGLFVGPTSQAPRVDEARHDSLYELEIALDTLAEVDVATFPWTVDRVLRHLLVDVSGNSHRTELCIDKLYSPASLAGRQGIVELRAFEMPPHARMCSAQMLLLRGMIARFAKSPYQQPLVQWGSRLHDQFMLPHFLWADFLDVIEDLARHAVLLDSTWFQPFLDHRCPMLGRTQIGDVSIELRAALEPWPTLGEQAVGAAVARYVDSSLERVQVLVTGMVDARHTVTVNGLAVPLRPTGTAAQGIAGVRFRAWQPPECLHPTIAPHHPLRFDLIDTWAERSLGGCTYHVVHPDGRAYDVPPLTGFEAAARRAQRFSTEGHAPFPAKIQRLEAHPEQPYTLDLRRCRSVIRSELSDPDDDVVDPTGVDPVDPSSIRPGLTRSVDPTGVDRRRSDRWRRSDRG